MADMLQINQGYDARNIKVTVNGGYSWSSTVVAINPLCVVFFIYAHNRSCITSTHSDLVFPSPFHPRLSISINSPSAVMKP